MIAEAEPKRPEARLLQTVSAAVKAYRAPITVFLVTRVTLVFAVYVMLLFLPMFPKDGGARYYPGNLFFDGWVRWDALFYRDIALRGYDNVPDLHGFRDTRFFPLYPALNRAVGTVLGNVDVAAVLISNVAFLAALILLYALVRRYYDSGVALRTVTLLALFPTSYYFMAPYAEGLYLLLAVGTFYFGERKQWGPAAACAVLGTVTRIPGFTLPIGLALLYLEQIGRRRAGRDALWLLVGAAGIVAVLVMFERLTGNPFIFLTVNAGYFSLDQVRLFGQTLLNLVPSVLAAGQFNMTNLIHAVTILLAVYVLIRSWRRLPRRALFVWALLNVLIALPAWTAGYARYVVTIFPLFITAALLLRRQTVYTGILYVSTLLLAVFTALFATWRWIS